MIIGITGSLGTGKSTVAMMFSNLGAEVLNADKMAHALISEEPCFRNVVRRFGKHILNGNAIDRHKLAEIVFNDFKKLHELEKIIYPELKKKIKKRISIIKRSQGEKNIVIDVPLLFESGWDVCVDYAIVVTSGQAKQISRAVRQLGISKGQAINRIRAQMPLSEKIKLADIIIDNDKSLIQTKKQVERIWQKITQPTEKK